MFRFLRIHFYSFYIFFGNFKFIVNKAHSINEGDSRFLRLKRARRNAPKKCNKNLSRLLKPFALKLFPNTVERAKRVQHNFINRFSFITI